MMLSRCFLIALLAGCAGGIDDIPEEEMPPPPLSEGTQTLSIANKRPRYERIRTAAAVRGVRNAYLLAGIANDETGLAHCWSEATWACQGPPSPDCGGGPVIAGSADGPCSIQQGGLGMFQFDAGTFTDTLNKYGSDVLTVDGQIRNAIDYAAWMVRISVYTTNAETDAKARAWINNFDPNNATLRDQWISTVVRYYNGCQPGWSCWGPRYQTYRAGYDDAINQVGGLGFWEAGTTCGGSPITIGAIDAKYRALGGCASILGSPITEERITPDGVGRYSVLERGSIYWTPTTGAFEVHGRIRDHWAQLGWEAGALGYPTSDEFSVGADKRSNFEHGSITWHSQTDTFTVTEAP
jgi:hypothetical protein